MAKKDLRIDTPRGSVFQVQTKNGKCTAKLEWNHDFGSKMTGQLNNAQQFLDSEVLRGCSAYVPHDTGMLQQSGILGTEIGSGEVNWIAPYAASQYYNTAQSRIYDPKRGGMWFERWKADHGKQTVKKAKKMGGGG